MCGHRALQTLRQPGDMPKHLPVGSTQVVLNNFSKNSPPYHIAQDDVWTPLQLLEVKQITGHQSVRGQDGVIAVLYKTHWAGLSEPSWEREMDLHLSRSRILRYLAGTTAKPTACTAECGSGRHTSSPPATTRNVS